MPNDAPIINSAISNQIAIIGELWVFQISSDAFSDPNNDPLEFSATLSSGDPLPLWLSFDPITRTFSGNPPEDFGGAIEFKITATDGSLVATDSFTLTPAHRILGSDGNDFIQITGPGTNVIDGGAGIDTLYL